MNDIIVKIDKNDNKKQFKTAKTVRFDQKTLTNSRNKSKIKLFDLRTKCDNMYKNTYNNLLII